MVARSVRLRFFIQRMEYDQRVIIRFLYKERVSPENIHARLEAQFGDTTYSDRSLRRRYQYVRQRGKDMHDEVRSGRPPLIFLTSEFWNCWTNSLFNRFIRLLKPGSFPLNYLE
jgi:hypothetical protein